MLDNERMTDSEREIAEPDFRPSASLDALRRRARLVRFVREFFEQRGYWEVATPVLSHDVVVDAHLDPFVVQDDLHGTLFLQTSPEFGMKRLLAAGAKAIYQITRAFRRGERGELHNPEFTILEWYRAGDTHIEQMAFTEELTRAVFREFAATGIDDVDYERLTYDAAFERYCGTRVLELDRRQLRELAARHDLAPPAGLREDDRDGWLNLLLTSLVEPHLGIERPVLLYDYPASQCALACVRDAPPVPPLDKGGKERAVAERFELYVNGIEICNGYHELRDADELRRRMDEQAEIRRREGHRRLPADNRLLAAMEAGLPASSGVALGLDRLVMLAFGLQRLEEVVAFPIDRA